MMNKFTIDTNVAIIANGKDGKGELTTASISCQFSCLDFLEKYKEITIALDNTDLIMNEYAKHLSYAGKPGVGDEFFKYLHDNQHDVSKKIHLVTITPSNDENHGFEELPVNTLDKSDRKFLATAVVAKATIVNATDSDWTEQGVLLNQLNIELKQLCPEHSGKQNVGVLHND